MDIYGAFKQFLLIKDIPFEENDRFVSFQFEGWNFVLLVDNDPYYYRLALPRVATIPTDSPDLLSQRALRLSGVYKVAKAVIVQNEVWLLFEEILGDYDFKNTNLFERSIKILSSFARELKNNTVVGVSEPNEEEGG